MTTQRYDAIIVGGGHNGLVCAAYLARAGRKVLVLERRHVLGGAAVSEELHPGFHFSVCSYVVSLFRPKIIRDLDLTRHGLEMIPLESSFTPLPDGRSLCRWPEWHRTRREIAKFSERDADIYPEFGLAMSKMAYFARELIDNPAPDPTSLNPRELMRLMRLGKRMQSLGPDMMHLNTQLLTMSASDFLDLWFESEVLKAPMAVSGIIGTFLGVRSPGTAYVLLHHYMGEIDGAFRSWGYVKGGTGQLSNAVANAARSLGVEIRTEAPVERVLLRNGEAEGVVLENGDEIRAKVVVSGLDPRRTFLSLVGEDNLDDEFLTQLGRFKYRGSSGKVNLAVDRLPEFACRPSENGRAEHLRGDIAIAPGIDYLEIAYDEAKYGDFSRRPYINMVIPSVLDPSVAPPGKHVVSCFVQYAPYHIKEGPENWPDRREAFGDAVVDTLEEYCPGFKDTILYRQVLTPWDLEQEFGLTEGNIFHGELSPEQLLFQRPVSGWAHYKTPIHRLWMCASGTHPGGGVMGAPGMLAARAHPESTCDMSAYDVIVIGGGHNGLVTAAALAAKGRSVMILEQGERIGGLAVGDEFHPGYTSTGPLHDTSGFAPLVNSALELGLEREHTAVFAPQLPDDGPGLLLHSDAAEAAEEIGRHSSKDAQRYADYRTFIDRIRTLLTRLFENQPPSPTSLWSVIGPSVQLRRLGRSDMLEVLRVGPMCLADWLNEHFETELLSSTLALPALSGTRSGPWSPGTAANLLRYEAMARPGIKGGPPALIDALERTARDRGVAIRTGAHVAQIRTEGDRVIGVTLADGETIDGGTVAASCDPRQTLLELLPPASLAPKLHHRMTKVRAEGAMATIDVALAAPLRFACRPDLDVSRARVVGSLDDMERAFDATKYGRVSTEPILEIVVPSIETPAMAPEGHHVATIMAHFAPYELRAGWNDDAAKSLGDTVIARLAQFAPDLPDSIIARRVQTPVDLETRYGATGGHIHHVEHALDHLIVRPDPECSHYATPMNGLYLCGSGSHPGGGLTGLPGMLAANAILAGS